MYRVEVKQTICAKKICEHINSKNIYNGPHCVQHPLWCVSDVEKYTLLYLAFDIRTVQ